MWSSPVLLLVLVFTLTSATTSRTSATTSSTSATSMATTTMPQQATTTTEAVKVHPARRAPPVRSRPRSRSAAPILATATVPTTPSTRSIGTNFSSVTRSTVQPVASVPNANAMNGALSGSLKPPFAVADVPLQGPGTWTLTSSASTNQTLSCGSVASPVTSRVVVGDAQICQLEITSTAGEASTWQLTPDV